MHTICTLDTVHCPGCGSTDVRPYLFSDCCDVPVIHNQQRCDGRHTAGRDYREPPFRDVDPGVLTFPSAHGFAHGLTHDVDEVLEYRNGRAIVVISGRFSQVVDVPLESLTAVRAQPGLGLEPVPWG